MDEANKNLADNKGKLVHKSASMPNMSEMIDGGLALAHYRFVREIKEEMSESFCGQVQLNTIHPSHTKHFQFYNFLLNPDSAQISSGEGQENGNKSAQGDVRRVTSSSSLSKIMKQKKMDHNAKERVRRTHLNTAYIALRSSLPESHKPKKKWSASYLIDRAVDHIPQLEGDLVKLKSKKKDLLLEVEKVHDLKRAEEAEKREKTLSVCINEVKRGQLILQICRQRNKFSELLDMIENEGMEILNTFMLDTCEDRSSHHIHVKMDVSSVGGGDYVAELKEKLVTWLS